MKPRSLFGYVALVTHQKRMIFFTTYSTHIMLMTCYYLSSISHYKGQLPNIFSSSISTCSRIHCAHHIQISSLYDSFASLLFFFPFLHHKIRFYKNVIFGISRKNRVYWFQFFFRVFISYGNWKFYQKFHPWAQFCLLIQNTTFLLHKILFLMKKINNYRQNSSYFGSKFSKSNFT